MSTKQSNGIFSAPLREQWRSLRWQLVLRTLLPLGLLVLTFAIVGQIGYTQVSESLARNRDTEIARLQTARVADYLLDTVKALRQLGSSTVLFSSDPQKILNTLRDESISQHFDYLLVSDSTGKVIAASDGTTGGSLLDPDSLTYLSVGRGLPMTLSPGELPDGREAIVFSLRYKDSEGLFAGVVEGAIAYGSQKLAGPLQDVTATAYQGATQNSPSGFSYLAAGNRIVFWHPDAAKVGTPAGLILANGTVPTSPGADIKEIDGTRYIIGYAPLNLGQLLTQTRPYAPWVTWYVVTQHRWADVVAPINALLYFLVVLALTMFLLALVLVARSANRLTVPVAKLLAASQALSAGKLRQRLDLIDISGPTEIEELARQFNSMAEQLHFSYSSLENKVAARTSELATANAELARKLRESETIQEVAARFAGTASLEDVLKTTVVSVPQAIDSEGCAVFLPSEDHPGFLEATVVKDIPGVAVGTLLEVGASLTGLAYSTGEPQVSTSTLTDPRAARRIAEIARTMCNLAVPLVAGGQTIGALTTTNKKGGDFSQDDVRLVTLLANQAAIAIERARLYTEARKQVETLETVNELSLSVTASQSLADTHAGGMEHIGKLLGVKSSVLYLFDEKRRALELTSTYSLPPILNSVILAHPTLYVDAEYDRPVGAVNAYRLQQPFVIEDMTDPDYIAAWRQAHRAASGLDPEDAIPMVQIRSLMALPLTVREKPLGTITLYFETPLSLRPAEMRLFQSFANILALAVYNTELVAQTSKLATVEERARLARELHDSVTQSLFSLNLTLKAARRNIEANPEKADKLLDNVQDLAQGALAEMRALIFELRPQALANEGLTSALEKHADSVKARSGLPVRLEINGDRRLPIETEEALYQIAREALHNVVKHSQATEAWVKLDMKGSDVTLSIKDNGRGFDTEKLKTDGGSHIGTSTMRERANAIGGTIEITSAPGSGTEVLVTTRVPLGSANSMTGPVEEAFTAPSQNGTRGTEVGV